LPLPEEFLPFKGWWVGKINDKRSRHGPCSINNEKEKRTTALKRVTARVTPTDAQIFLY